MWILRAGSWRAPDTIAGAVIGQHVAVTAAGNIDPAGIERVRFGGQERARRQFRAGIDGDAALVRLGAVGRARRRAVLAVPVRPRLPRLRRARDGQRAVAPRLHGGALGSGDPPRRGAAQGRGRRRAQRGRVERDVHESGRAERGERGSGQGVRRRGDDAGCVLDVVLSCFVSSVAQ